MPNKAKKKLPNWVAYFKMLSEYINPNQTSVDVKAA